VDREPVIDKKMRERRSHVVVVIDQE